jgi:hypothetical protein
MNDHLYSPEEDFARNLSTYDFLCRQIPNFSAKLNSYVDRPDKVTNIIRNVRSGCFVYDVQMLTARIRSQLTKGHTNARGNDIKSLKIPVLSFVAKAVGMFALDPPIDPAKSKEDTRGMHHPVIGQLLMPADWSQLNDADREAYVTHAYLPRVSC